MRDIDLKGQMLTAMDDASLDLPVGATAGLIWGGSLWEIIKVVGARAVELGREYIEVIRKAGYAAVDALVAMDLPWIPPSVEGVIDEATRKLGYAAVDAVLNAVLPEQVQP